MVVGEIRYVPTRTLWERESKEIEGQLSSRVAAGTMKATQIRSCKLEFEQRVRSGNETRVE
jgi:hypothetical protein